MLPARWFKFEEAERPSLGSVTDTAFGLLPVRDGGRSPVGDSPMALNAVGGGGLATRSRDEVDDRDSTRTVSLTKTQPGSVPSFSFSLEDLGSLGLGAGGARMLVFRKRGTRFWILCSNVFTRERMSLTICIPRERAASVEAVVLAEAKR